MHEHLLELGGVLECRSQAASKTMPEGGSEIVATDAT